MNCLNPLIHCGRMVPKHKGTGKAGGKGGATCPHCQHPVKRHALLGGCTVRLTARLGQPRPYDRPQSEAERNDIRWAVRLGQPQAGGPAPVCTCTLARKQAAAAAGAAMSFA